MSLLLQNLTHRFGPIEAVSDVTLKARRGEILCLFGPSGCGKTTVLRLGAGLEKLQTGSVLMDGETLATAGRELPPEKRPVGFVFQDFVLFPHLTVEKNVAFGIDAKGKAARQAVAEQLEKVDLLSLLDRFPHELSGGQQQRVALARALIRKPQALLLDEPFASIDVTRRRQLREDLRHRLKEENIAVILVTHDPEEALALGDEIALMREGALIETGQPEALFSDPQTAQGASLFPNSQSLTGNIKAGVFTSPLGDLPAPSLSDGNGVAILRDGALTGASDSAGGLEVIDCRLEGPGWKVWVALPGHPERLWVRMPRPVDIGTRVEPSLNHGNIFIYRNQ